MPRVITQNDFDDLRQRIGRVDGSIAETLRAWAMEPRMSCRHNRQSNEIDSVNRATSAPGPPANRPLRETGAIFFFISNPR